MPAPPASLSIARPWRSLVVVSSISCTTSERQGRVIDKDAGGAGMEKKKQEGYF